MIRHLFLFPIRFLARKKISTAFNITGLSIGMACVTLIMLFIMDELNYNQHLKDVDRMYRFSSVGSSDGSSFKTIQTPRPLAPACKNDFPEISEITHFLWFWNRSIQVENKHFYEDNFLYADTGFISFFGLHLINGDPSDQLIRPNTLVITQSTAQRYFGDKNPLHQSVTIYNNFRGDTIQLEITGVIEDIPSKTSFKADLIASESSLGDDFNPTWWVSGFQTYFKLKEGSDPKLFQQKIDELIPKYVGPQVEESLNMSLEEFNKRGNSYSFSMMPVNKIHLFSDMTGEMVPPGNIKYIFILSCVAFLILILTCINYINLSTAQASLRSVEIGIRKVSGAGKNFLRGQLLWETLLQVVFAHIVSIILIELCLPLFNRIFEKDLALNIFSIDTSLFILALVLFTTLMAGAYPSFVLSSFQPIKVLKGTLTNNPKRLTIRKLLIVVQISLSVLIAISTLIVLNQLFFMQNSDSGFNKNNMVIIERTDPIRRHVKSFMKELGRIPEIKKVSLTSPVIGKEMSQRGFQSENKENENLVLINVMEVDENYQEVAGFQMKEGRWFSEEYFDSASIVINEKTAKSLHLTDPIGKRIFYPNPESDRVYYTIIGVIKDFHFASMHQPIQPLLFLLNRADYEGYISLRLHSDNYTHSLKAIESVWHQFAPSDPLVYYFYDKEFERFYKNELLIRKVLIIFSILSFLIATIGIMGLIAYTATQRTKEIGIRKSMGASIQSIVMIFSKDISILVFIGNIIAWPLAYYVSYEWLKEFAYKIDITLLYFILPGIFSLGIAILTAVMISKNAASLNPVKTLRYE